MSDAVKRRVVALDRIYTDPVENLLSGPGGSVEPRVDADHVVHLFVPILRNPVRGSALPEVLDSNGRLIANLPLVTDTNGRLLVNASTGGILPVPGEVSDIPVDNTDAAILIAAGQVYELIDAFFSAQCAAVVASRTWGGTYTPARATAQATIRGVATPTLTLTTGEDGDAWLSAAFSEDVVTHDNGTQAVSTNAARPPHVVIGGDILTSSISANKQTGDRTGISLITRRVT